MNTSQAYTVCETAATTGCSYLTVADGKGNVSLSPKQSLPTPHRPSQQHMTSLLSKPSACSFPTSSLARGGAQYPQATGFPCSNSLLPLGGALWGPQAVTRRRVIAQAAALCRGCSTKFCSAHPRLHVHLQCRAMWGQPGYRMDRRTAATPRKAR